MKLPLRHLTLVLVGLAAPVLTHDAGARPGLPTQDEGESTRSLEDLLRLARTERDQVLSELKVGVEAILAEMESATVRVRPEEALKFRKQMIAMGPEIAPLLLKALLPGPSPSRAERFRAMEVVQVLRDLRSPSIGMQLLDSSRRGTPEGRVNSLLVLATDPNPERVIGGVRSVHAEAQAEVRTAALVALAQLGSPDLPELLSADFAKEEIAHIGSLLMGLAQVDHEEIPSCVVQLLATERAPALVSPLLDYYSASRKLLKKEEHLLALIRLACQPAMDGNDAVKILDTLSQFDVTVKGATKKALDDLRDSSQLALRESTLVLLARSKDKSARRSLLQSFDERVKYSPASPSVYSMRGDVYYLIAEYQKAIKDFKTAISLQRGLASKGGAHLGIARSYARLKRYSDAEEYLRAAPVSMTTLRDLAKDPAFEEMLETKYRRAFHLKE
ncbi:MAG TPA: tetratricopeptide repeat protein [Planctomycetes bacterium]|nr:tetratricopeptide repeat protein [Planctomycetota bacterium]